MRLKIGSVYVEFVDLPNKTTMQIKHHNCIFNYVSKLGIGNISYDNEKEETIIFNEYKICAENNEIIIYKNNEIIAEFNNGIQPLTDSGLECINETIIPADAADDSSSDNLPDKSPNRVQSRNVPSRRIISPNKKFLPVNNANTFKSKSNSQVPKMRERSRDYRNKLNNLQNNILNEDLLSWPYINWSMYNVFVSVNVTNTYELINKFKCFKKNKDFISWLQNATNKYNKQNKLPLYRGSAIMRIYNTLVEWCNKN